MIRKNLPPLQEYVTTFLENYMTQCAGPMQRQGAGLYTAVMPEVERVLLQFALQKAAGNQSKAAQLLGINRNTLRKKMTEFSMV